MDKPATEDYKIELFDADVQQLLKMALKEPASVDLEKVASVIFEQSMKDLVFSKEAGRICYTIVQAEHKQSGQSNFRRCVLNRLQQEFRLKEQVRESSVNAWVCLVTFICNVFDYLKVDCLVLQLHRIGEQLNKTSTQRMDDLFCLLRDGFLLQDRPSSLSRLLLLEVIEFRAGGWKMSDNAQKYYYSEVAD
ncbi:MIF4G domain-containing protein B isoform X2 [Narcine bancroftii]|uniref:MIF4G domain-containing protein B isoform X2 n=1 Tax=Narcine bancroftii TaxID=1343680 RepID=UPI003831B12E